jgi:light-regulated signal transduction histidine kinase (bacteriophytochrome)
MYYPALGRRVRSAIGVPLLVEDRLLGVLQARTSLTHHFGEHNVQLLQKVGERKEQEHVCELFHRAPGVQPQGSTGSRGSMGLGLYISKRLVELHYGQVGVASEAGQSATFWFKLLLITDCESAADV